MRRTASGSRGERAFHRARNGWVAAATLIAALAATAARGEAVPAPPPGFPAKGVLQLQLGKANRVVYVPPAPPATGSAPSPQVIETIRRNDCRVAQPSAVRLLDFQATQGSSAVPVGLVAGSMGAYSGSQGTPCSRISAPLAHALTVDLGPSLAAAIPDVAFHRLELDIEAKGNLSLELQVLIGGVAVKSYYLRTGSSIVSGEGSNVPGAPIFNCSAASDSGPDSGARDNCRWVIDELGEGFRLVPLAGEGSLEGGSDGTGLSLVYLTQGDIGVLGCGQGSGVPLSQNTNTIGDGFNDAQCAVSRIDPTGFGGACTQPIGYVFRNLGGLSAEGCELIKSPGEQLAASIDILFPPEPSAALGAEPRTKISFSRPDGSLVPFTPERCTGTVVLDRNGKRTIREVLLGTLPAVVDQVPETSAVDWACILDNEQEYLGPVAGPKMQVFQTILFWGDIRFSRE